MRIVTNPTHMGVSESAKVLLVFPHPDDETVFSAGLMQKPKRNGNTFHLIMLTRGEASTLTYGLTNDQQLSNVRESELERAMKTLGVSSYRLMAFPDGKLSETAELNEFIRLEIKSFEPDIVVTFEPAGVYGHPDHVCLSRIVTDLQTELHTFDILYATVLPAHFHTRSSLKMSGGLKKVKSLKPQYVLLLSRDEIVRKYKAMRAHKSQFSFTPLKVIRWFWNGLWLCEFYTMKNPEKV